jgi:hypothetical protein
VPHSRVLRPGVPAVSACRFSELRRSTAVPRRTPSGGGQGEGTGEELTSPRPRSPVLLDAPQAPSTGVLRRAKRPDARPWLRTRGACPRALGGGLQANARGGTSQDGPGTRGQRVHAERGVLRATSPRGLARSPRPAEDAEPWGGDPSSPVAPGAPLSDSPQLLRGHVEKEVEDQKR